MDVQFQEVLEELLEQVKQLCMDKAILSAQIKKMQKQSDESANQNQEEETDK